MDAVARRLALALLVATASLSGARGATINQFAPAQSLSGTDIVPLYQAQTGTVRTSLNDLAAFVLLQLSQQAGQGAGGSGNVTLGSAAYASIGTSGASVPLLSGANTWTAPQMFSGLVTAIGGHVVGTGDFTSSQTLTAANEDTVFSCSAQCTATLPPAPVNGTPIYVHDMSATAGLLTVAGNGAQIMTPTGLSGTYQYTRYFQGARWIYHAFSGVWVAQ